MDYHTMIYELEKKLKPELHTDPNNISNYKIFIHNTKIWNQIRFISFLEDKLCTLNFDLNLIETYLCADSVDDAVAEAGLMNSYQAQAFTNQENTVAKIKELRTKMKTTSSKLEKRHLEHEERNVRSIQAERLRLINGIKCLKEMLGAHTFKEALNIISKSKLNKTDLKDFDTVAPKKFSNGHLTPYGKYMNSCFKKVENEPVATYDGHKSKSHKANGTNNDSEKEQIIRQLESLANSTPYNSQHKSHK